MEIRFNVNFEDDKYEGFVDSGKGTVNLLEKRENGGHVCVAIPLLHWPAVVKKIKEAIDQAEEPKSSGLSWNS